MLAAISDSGVNRCTVLTLYCCAALGTFFLMVIWPRYVTLYPMISCATIEERDRRLECGPWKETRDGRERHCRVETAFGVIYFDDREVGASNGERILRPREFDCRYKTRKLTLVTLLIAFVCAGLWFAAVWSDRKRGLCQGGKGHKGDAPVFFHAAN
jgi:hypothetical protein